MLPQLNAFATDTFSPSALLYAGTSYTDSNRVSGVLRHSTRVERDQVSFHPSSKDNRDIVVRLDLVRGARRELT